MMRGVFSIVLAALFLLSATPVPVLAQGLATPAAQAQKDNPLRTAFDVVNGFFDALFTKITGKGAEPDPTQTGLAPFADTDQLKAMTPEQQAKGALALPAKRLDEPHRNSRDLENWLMDAIADMMSFDADSYPLYVEHIFPRGMSPGGIAEFHEWITGTGLLDAMRNNGMQLNALATGRPVLLNEGVLSERYRWLYEIPVLISFVPKGTTVYEKNLAVNSQEILVTLQIGRVQDSMLEHNVMIETWSVRAAPKDR